MFIFTYVILYFVFSLFSCCLKDFNMINKPLNMVIQSSTNTIVSLCAANVIGSGCFFLNLFSSYLVEITIFSLLQLTKTDNRIHGFGVRGLT